jgi:hypothetical protein
MRGHAAAGHEGSGAEARIDLRWWFVGLKPHANPGRLTSAAEAAMVAWRFGGTGEPVPLSGTKGNYGDSDSASQNDAGGDGAYGTHRGG